MCVVSMVMDHYRDKWSPGTWPTSFPLSPPYVPPIRDDEIEEFRRLLDRARQYDKEHHEPDCELQEKKDAIKRLADAAGVKIDFL